MGVSSSSTGGAFGSNSDPSQIPIPQDPIPFTGPKGRYHIIECPVEVTPQWGFGQTTILSNVDSHYQKLSQPYGSGFRLISFYCIPNMIKRKTFSTTSTFTYFGMFFQSQLPHPPSEQWQLTVVKSQMEIQLIGTGLLSTEVQGRTGKIVSALDDMAKRGGRLVCIENTQKLLAQTMKRAFTGFGPVQGVDLFLEMPLHPNPTIYNYAVANVPMKLHAGFGGVNVTGDWNGVFGQYLNRGWRLVEIYLDQGARHRAFSTTATMNSVWFFEKDTALMADERPRYQGTIVYYELKSTTSGSGVVAHTGNWGALLSSMGDKGWELACILDIPNAKAGFMQMTSTLLFFFQRPMF